MFSSNSRDTEGLKIHKKLCQELKINENDADAAALKEMINSYMKNKDNLVISAELSVRRSYFAYKMQQQLQAEPAAISNDMQSMKIHKELCEELHINENDADATTIKDMINSYMKKEGNLNREAEIRLRFSYFSHKIQQQVQAQVVAISSDANNLLKHETNPAQIIISHLKKIALKVADKQGINPEDKLEFNKEYLKNIFEDEELPTVLYVLNHCPLIVKDDKENYCFTSTQLLIHLHTEAMYESGVKLDEEHRDDLNKMITPRF